MSRVRSTSRPVIRSSVKATVAALAVLAAATACGQSHAATTADEGGMLRLGYFANVNHAVALIGVHNRLFQQALGVTRLRTQVFNAGPDEVTALLGGTIDAAYVGPSPAINAFVQSHGSAIRIVSGASLGGASLVVRPGITSAAALTGKRIATPQLGNTQDVALRSWLNSHGHHVTLTGGDVNVQPTDNATAFELFRQGKLDGAWVPEPWASRYVVQAHATVLVDEASLWPQGRFATTVLMVSTKYLAAHPDRVAALIKGELAAVNVMGSTPAAAQGAVNDELLALTGKSLPRQVLARAFQHVTLSVDPAASTLETLAEHAYAVHTLRAKPVLHGILDLTILNRLLAATGRASIASSGLGR